MIAHMDDADSLKELKTLVVSFVGNHIKDTDYWDELSEVEKSELEHAILESEDESNHVSHEKVMKTYQSWIGK